MSDSRQALDKLLDSIGESSQFVTSGSLTPTLPGLEVEEVGSIDCPVSPTDAKQLVTMAVRAPYGRGEATIVETDVRRVWQIEPSRLMLRNADWARFVSGIVDTVELDFGIDEPVSVHLYKLLIYEKGSFSAP